MPRVITLDELRARLESGDPVTLVEALPPMYYERERLPGAINIPHDEVDALAPSCSRTATPRSSSTAPAGPARTPASPLAGSPRWGTRT